MIYMVITMVCVFCAMLPGTGPYDAHFNALLWALAAGNALLALTEKKD